MKFFGLFFLMASTCWARPEVIFTSPVEVSVRETVRLTDLVEVVQPTEELLGALESMTLPMKNQYDAKEISSLVKNEMEKNEGLRKLNPSFKIPSELKVQASAGKISKAETGRRLLNILRTRCGECEYKLSIQSVPFPATGPWDIDYAAVPAKGAFLISLHDTDARSVKWISGSIKVSKPVPVATKLLQSGERLQVGDAKMAMVDVTFAKDTSLSLADLNGQLLQRQIQNGSPIWSADLKREAAAKRGQIVRAISGSEDFEVSANMEAQENGFIGDTIKIKNTETQKTFSGLVTDKGTVKIQ